MVHAPALQSDVQDPGLWWPEFYDPTDENLAKPVYTRHVSREKGIVKGGNRSVALYSHPLAGRPAIYAPSRERRL